jgi:uncharacterized protein
MAEPILIAKNLASSSFLLPKMANRHGLIAGATGTGKTVTLQTLAEGFSKAGVPVFMADVKGDLSGMSQSAGENKKVQERIALLGLHEYIAQSSPVTFWDVFSEQGHPIRTTVTEMGPLLLSRMLDLNAVQTGVLHAIFKIADDEGLLLLDLKDLRAMAQHAAEHSEQYQPIYGNISAASVGAIQRNLLQLEMEGGGQLFGEPAVNLDDMLKADAKGRGMVNILASNKLFHSPRVYGTLLLWMLSELYENLPEAGDLDKPKLVFFFDEAHLLFNDAPKAFMQKIEQVIRLIRSKAVGVYFVSQNPLDIPDVVLGQLGNRVQHALRAYTPRDQKAVKAAAETFRVNPAVDVVTSITELGVGEALVSFLDEKGAPKPVERSYVCPPESRIGPATEAERTAVITSSHVNNKYEVLVDRESAYELLTKRAEVQVPTKEEAAKAEEATKEQADERGFDWGGVLTGERVKPSDSTIERVAKKAIQSFGAQIGRAILRGVLGTILGKR